MAYDSKGIFGRITDFLWGSPSQNSNNTNNAEVRQTYSSDEPDEHTPYEHLPYIKKLETRIKTLISNQDHSWAEGKKEYCKELNDEYSKLLKLFNEIIAERENHDVITKKYKNLTSQKEYIKKILGEHEDFIEKCSKELEIIEKVESGEMTREEAVKQLRAHHLGGRKKKTKKSRRKTSKKSRKSKRSKRGRNKRKSRRRR